MNVDRNQIRAFASLLDHTKGGCFEIRCLGNGHPQIKFFTDIDSLVSFAAEQNGKQNIYVGLHPRSKDCLSLTANDGAKDTNILFYEWFPIDIDTIRPGKNLSANREELEAAKKVTHNIANLLSKKGIIPIHALSGNGWHLLVRVEYPNSEEVKKKFGILLRWFARFYNSKDAEVDPVVFNPSRIWKLYGTLAMKGPHSPDRPHRLAKFKIPETPPKPVDILAIFSEEIEEQNILENPPRDRRENSRYQEKNFKGKGDLSTLDIVVLCTDKGMYRKSLDGGKHAVTCPWETAHTTGDPNDTSTVIWEADGTKWPGFHCAHAHCDGRKINDFLKHYGPETIDRYCRGEFKERSTSNNRNNASNKSHKEPPKPLALISVGELLSKPIEEIDFVVDGLLTKGGLSMNSAKPKTGKSTLARQLALCVARGEDFLGKKTTPGLVICLSLEERERDVRDHFGRMGATDADNIKVFAGMAPPDALERLRAAVEIEKPVLIIIDTLARLAGIKEFNDYGETIQKLEPFLAIARETGAHIHLIHHAKKGQDKSIDAVLGSTGLAGSVDTIIFMHRTERQRTISCTYQRVGEALEESVLNFDTDYGWSTLGGSKDEVDIDQTKKAIAEFLACQKEPVKEDIITEEVEGKTTNIRRGLRQLVQEDKVERLGKGGKKDPYHYRSKILQKGPDQRSAESSCSDVPTYTGEHENMNQRNDVSALNIKTSSCSQENIFFENDGNMNLEPGTSKMTATDLKAPDLPTDALEVDDEIYLPKEGEVLDEI